MGRQTVTERPLNHPAKLIGVERPPRRSTQSTCDQRQREQEPTPTSSWFSGSGHGRAACCRDGRRASWRGGWNPSRLVTLLRWSCAVGLKESHPARLSGVVVRKSRQRPTFAFRLSSAQTGLTAVFGMGTGVALSVRSPGKLVVRKSVETGTCRDTLWQRENRGTDSMTIKPMGRLVPVS